MRKMTVHVFLFGVLILPCMFFIGLGQTSDTSFTNGFVSPDSVPDPGTPGPFSVSRDDYTLPDVFITAPRSGGGMLTARVEVRGSVHAPTDLSQGPFPVVFFLHGRHATCKSGVIEFSGWPCPGFATPIWSYQGYDYISSILASWGYMVISVSANGINAVDNNWTDFGGEERALLMLWHMDRWNDFNTTGGPPPIGTRFVGALDLTNIGVMGHSRGGEGAVRTFLRNFEVGSPGGNVYGINAVFPLAPINFLRRQNLARAQGVTDVQLGVLLPYCDGDVANLEGALYYDDTRYSLENDSGYKQYVLVMGANHNYYNTVWTAGRTPDDWTYDPLRINDQYCGRLRSAGGGRLTAAEQRDTGIRYIVGFMRVYIGGEFDFWPMFTGDDSPPPPIANFDIYNGYHAASLPDPPTRLDVHRFTGASDLTTNTLGGAVTQTGLSPYVTCVAPSCGVVQPHRDVRQLNLGWNSSSAQYRNQIPSASGNVSGYSALSFRVGVKYNDGRNPVGQAKDLSVVLVDASGQSASVRVSDFKKIFYPPSRPYRDDAGQKTVLQTVRIPLDAFTGVDLTNIRAVQIDFNQQSQGALLISDIAFAQ